MKKVLKIVGIVVLLLIAFVLIAAIFIPKDYHLERSITINASQEKLWPLVSKFRSHTQWSPFIKKDPNVALSYEGEDGTVGAKYKWKGNSDVGSGEQTITELKPTNYVKTHLHFIDPFEGEADAFIRLDPDGGATKATWGFDANYPYPSNAMMLFVNLEEMLGKDYSDGLANLKRIAE